MSLEKTVSVVVPCYNGEKYIKKCLDSLFIQTVKPLEIIVVDDGSTDNSASIISKYPVKLIRHNSNRGVAQARNTGIAHAKGEIIVFINVDDIADPQMIENLIKNYTTEQIAGVGGQAIEINRVGLINSYRSKYHTFTRGNRKIINPDFLFGDCCSYRRDRLIEIGLFDPFFRTGGDDVYIGLKLKKLGFMLIYEPKAIVSHVRDDDLWSFLRKVFRDAYYGTMAYIRNGLLRRSILRTVKWFICKSIVGFFKAFKLKDPVYAVMMPLIALVSCIADIKAQIHACL